ncbi:MAG: ornithine cyclodeaminase family protein [Hyphomicrobiaceae bacterium]
MAQAATRLLTISGADILALVDPAKVIDALADGFKALADGSVQAPPRPKVDVPGKGFSLAMLAWAPGQHIALKTVNVFDGNHALGLESHQALVTLFDATTGAPVALLEGGSLTGIRTAAAAMLSVRLLARRSARKALVVGGGVQAREHVRQLNLVGTFDEIAVYARQPATAQSLAGSIPNSKAVSDLEAAARQADVICLTTSSTTPVIQDDWVKPGTHVTSVGFAPPHSEVPKGLVGRARLFVEAMTAFEPAPVGCAELAGIDKSRGADLGSVLKGTTQGRTSDTGITLYNSLGNAMEDMIAANIAYEAAVAAGIGSTIEL